VKEYLVSIIIPFYNAEKFISETLRSVISQSNVLFEIIAIDDGSTDLSRKIIENFQDERIQYYYQVNKGVSYARNVGLSYAKGKYVIFFDADDIMTENYIVSRYNYLENNPGFNLVCGEVIKFNSDCELNGYYRGAGVFAIYEILLYNKEVVTCPSNYMIRKDFLLKNKINFNVKLASTADRFFLLECAKTDVIKFEKKVGKLHYRVSKNSMSNTLNKKLVNDNELFYKELLFINLVPNNIKKSVLLKGYYVLLVSYLKINSLVKAVSYLFKYINLRFVK